MLFFDKSICNTIVIQDKRKINESSRSMAETFHKQAIKIDFRESVTRKNRAYIVTAFRKSPRWNVGVKSGLS